MADELIEPSYPPFAIGGLGGSGTRATAMLVRNCGCWLGGDLNSALDNLWFTLLFKRPSVMAESDARLAHLFGLFAARMEGQHSARTMDAQALERLARDDRYMHSAEWLRARVDSFIRGAESPPPDCRWGWKEPNTHVVIDRLFRLSPGLKYVHVVRDPHYMAQSQNQNQLQIWGPVFLDRVSVQRPEDAFAYWVAVHRRLDALQSEFPGRILFFSHDRFMLDPESQAAALLEFLELDPPSDKNQLFEGIVFKPPAPPDTQLDADPDDLAFCTQFMSRFN
jgi:hypothetical protein